MPEAERLFRLDTGFVHFIRRRHIPNGLSLGEQARQHRRRLLQHREPAPFVVDDLLTQPLLPEFLPIGRDTVEHQLDDLIAGDPRFREPPAVVQLDDSAAGNQGQNVGG